jgi:LacI family transcriptional regulator
MKQKITLKDIARELGVSISTVSKALKNSEEISRDTKERIQAFAKLYNYRPNNIAISLKNKRSRNIGVIIPNIVHHFFTTCVRGVELYANAKGYNVIVCLSDESFDKEVINMEMLANGSIDGFIMSLSMETMMKDDYNHLKEVTDQGIPLVLFDRTTDEVVCDKVVIGDREAAYMAVKKLIDSGRKRIGVITSDDYLIMVHDRMEGYKEALTEAGIPIYGNLILPMSQMQFDEEAVHTFLETQKVDAIVTVNEIFAVRAMKMAQRKGFKVPEDIAFIGFTDGLLSKYANPSLTSVDQHGELMGEHAARMLINKIESEQEEETYTTEILKATLIERESTP